MANVLFISESYLKNNSLIDDNVDQRIILPSIITAQDMRSHPILGTPLYDENDRIYKVTMAFRRAVNVAFGDQVVEFELA